MGVLRTEPKRKHFVSKDEYMMLYNILKDAQEIAKTKHTFYDMDEEENVIATKKKFQMVAGKENIEVVIRRIRGTNSLSFTFP